MQVYSSMVYSDGSGKAELELGSLKAGFYTLVVKNNKGIRSYKIVRSKN